MRLSQGVATSQIPGAGASLRVRWPSVVNSLAGMYSKFGSLPNGVSIANSGGFSVNPGLYKGMVCAPMGSNNSAFSWYGVQNISWATERPAGAVTRDWSCWNIRMTAAYTTTGPLVGDFGLMIGCGGNDNNTKMNGFGAETHGGVVFGPTDVGTLSLRARAVKAGALTINTAVKTGFDITGWHTYELRIVTGSLSADPVMFGLLDGQVVTAKYPWTAAAGVLPDNDQGEGSQPFGYTLGWTNQSGLANGASVVYASEVVITAAQDEASLY